MQSPQSHFFDNPTKSTLSFPKMTSMRSTISSIRGSAKQIEGIATKKPVYKQYIPIGTMLAGHNP